MATNAFAELGLNEQILAGVEALGFTTPTPVQAQAIPAVLAGRDVVASAQTGTGKTAAFALPVLQIIAPLSRAAREELLATAPTEDEGADETAVLADEIVSDHLSVPAPDTDTPVQEVTEAPRPARRRTRRHHRRVETEAASDAPVTDTDAGAAVQANAEAQEQTPEPAAGEEQPKRRRRRRRRRSKRATEETPRSTETAPETQATDASAAEDKQEGASAEASAAGEEAPRKKRRRRKRKRKGSETEQRDSRERDESAHPFGPFALVVTPTRELAQQIERVAGAVCAHTGQRTVIVMGGARFERQIKDLERGCDMLVATPGRLIDLMEHDHVDLSHVSVLVLDEADRMLDMGFWPSVRRIIRALPETRQNLLFSATIPASIKPQIDAMLHDPVTVEIARVGETAETVEEHLMPVTQGQKIALLTELVRTGGAEEGTLERVLVFCRTKQRTDDVTRSLKAAGLTVDVMHADRPQSAREKALERFRDGRCQVLVATDVMSRGIDVVGIDAVVNFDVPLDPEDYVHRIGRTGRAGATGHAYTFMAPDEVSPLREIEYFTGKLVPTFDLPGFSYDEGRIMPTSSRSVTKPKRTMFSGTRSRGRGIAGGRYGRHY